MSRQRRSAVLLLNASYEPLHIVSLRRAVVLVLKEKAQILERAERSLHAERLSLPVPVVIRLVNYVRVPYRWRVPVSRRAVLARDGHTCQYCGARPARGALTLDHVVPRSQGGQHTWENLVAACGPCNRRKGNRRPAEAGMPLGRQPQRPKYMALALLESRVPHDHRQVWEKYLEPARVA